MNISKVRVKASQLGLATSPKQKSKDSTGELESQSVSKESVDTSDLSSSKQSSESSPVYNKELAAQEESKLWNKAKRGGIVGSILGAVGGVTAGIVGGVAGGVVGLAVAPAMGLLGTGLGFVAGFKLVCPSWEKVDALKILGGIVVGAAGAALGGSLGTYGGAALGVAAGAGGGVAGAVAGLVGGTTAGAAIGGMGSVGLEYALHPDQYTNLDAQVEEDAAKQRVKDARDQADMDETRKEFTTNLKELIKNPRKFD